MSSGQTSKPVISLALEAGRQAQLEEGPRTGQATPLLAIGHVPTIIHKDMLGPAGLGLARH